MPIRFEADKARGRPQVSEIQYHGTLESILGTELELRVRDNDGYDPSVLLWVRDTESKREVEVQMFMSEAEDLAELLARALEVCERICREFREAAEHEHKWQHQGHGIGPAIHGDTFFCECGAQRFMGLKDDRLVCQIKVPGGEWADAPFHP